MVALLWIAGALHLLLVVVNLLAPRRLGYAEGLVGAPPLVRQIFHVHAAYIVLVLLGFAALCFSFAPELAGGQGLGLFSYLAAVFTAAALGAGA